jgi:Ca2+-binding RTX toxin-like protein
MAVIAGDEQANNLEGTAAADTILGDAGDDILSGLEGDDTLLGELGSDILRGGPGNDRLDGGEGVLDGIDYGDSPLGVVVDLLAGIAADGFGGTDSIANVNAVRGSANVDILRGSDGETLEDFVGGAGDDTIDGRGGLDQINYAFEQTFFGSGVVVDLAAGTALDTFGNRDTLISIESVLGTLFDDVITGSDGSGELFVPQAGNDTIDGGGGVDDLLYGLSLDSVRVDLLRGTAEDGLGGLDTVRSIENVSGGNLADRLLGDGAANQLNGFAGDDLLIGRTGDDQLNGGDGNDRLFGYAGKDTLAGDAGDDSLRGLDNNDRLSGGAGDDWQSGDGGRDRLLGDAGADRLYGGVDSDVIYGGADNDFLSGGSGNDILAGSLGDDVLSGGLGNDQLRGSVGEDVLTGGDGSDRFIFATATEGVDRIRDFDPQSDILDLRSAILGSPGAAEIGGFVAFVTDGTSSELLVDRDGGGDGFVLLARLSGIIGLDAADLLADGHLLA